MLQMLIVDDEKEIREGLFAWPWKGLNIETVGCCSHGLEALQFLANNPVDIVLTDIRMPFMDGLELMEVLKRQYPFIHVIILSGYSDFEYARKALQLGAVDYILKPIVFEEMIQCMKKLTAHLEEEKQIEKRVNFLQHRAQQLSRVLRDKFLSELFHAPFPVSELEQCGAEGEVMLENAPHTAAVLRLDRFASQQPSLSKREMDLITFSLDNLLAIVWDKPGWRYHLVNKNTAETFLLSKDHPKQDCYESLIKKLLQYKGLFKSTFTIVSGPMVPGPERIHISLKAALKHLTNTEPNTIFLCPNDMDSWRDLAKDDIYSFDKGEDMEENGDSLTLAKAKQFIKNNYNRSITLREVADHVYISPSHLSALFKRNGITFLKYLTDIRIKHARELLGDLKYSIYEVGEKVGYSDPAYFSELFKKNVGMTPNEYRKHLRLSAY